MRWHPTSPGVRGLFIIGEPGNRDVGRADSRNPSALLEPYPTTNHYLHADSREPWSPCSRGGGGYNCGVPRLKRSGIFMRSLGHDLKALLLVVSGLFGALGARAQSAPVACPPAVAPALDQSASVAAAARSSKKPAVHAKKIIDDDDMALHH